MRTVIDLNQGWTFTKGDGTAAASVDLPHTWNALDGQDGGNDYYRGACRYEKTLDLSAWRGRQLFLEFEGVSLEAQVFLNGKPAGTHKGGFSTFRFDVTALADFDKPNELVVVADNSAHPDVYPQTADFTFYGGIYRDVHLIAVGAAHFDLLDDGSCGVYVTPTAQEDGSASLRVVAKTVDAQDCTLRYTLIDPDGSTALTQTLAPGEALQASLKQVKLWNGMRAPALYLLRAELVGPDGAVCDTVEVRTGFRSFHVDAQRGFFLNGKPYRLHGVSRHQDRENMGWAITKREHEEDIALIREIGANTIRLAHYQHNAYFYDLCDENGFVVWAEIPFISVMSDDPAAHENARSQLKELIKQNYNHPSICFWGVENEITMGGVPQELVENIKDLHALAKELDPNRPTTQACLTALETDSEINQITDVLAYNHYFGWYMGKASDFNGWLDDFHRDYSHIPLAISEYGAEGILQYHNDDPKVQDYSEEYHALYHETVWQIFQKREWLWATYVWNMFDFGSDLRDEGGVKGRNNKGLVTYDRKTKKDAFYLYKAYWSDEPFVHITGRRYVDRPYASATIKVYSNCPAVTLSVNGKHAVTRQGDRVFVFENVKLRRGENVLTAVAGEQRDEITLRRVGKRHANPAYVLSEAEGKKGINVANWFEGIDLSGPVPPLEFPEGYYSVKDKLSAILDNPQTLAVIRKYIPQELLEHPMLGMAKRMTLEKIRSMAGDMAPEGLFERVNAELIQIKKE